MRFSQVVAMNNTIICDSCGDTFSVGQVETAQHGDLEISYFTCPYCGKRTVYFASDEEMRGLVTRRREIADKVSMGYRKKFREKTLRKYLAEDAKIKKRQEKLLPELKKRGKEALEQGDAG